MWVRQSKNSQKWDCTNLYTSLFTVGMKHKKSHSPTLNAAEQQLIEQLRRYPELIDRFRSILEITASAEGPLKKADEIESMLIEEMRRLGHTTLETWAGRAEQTLAEQLKQRDASASVRKKKR